MAVARRNVLPPDLFRRRTVPPRTAHPMPNGPDQRPGRNRRPRRRSQTSRRPVTEQDEGAELQASRDRNDLHIRDLREMTVKDGVEVGVKLHDDDPAANRTHGLPDQPLELLAVPPGPRRA